MDTSRLSIARLLELDVPFEWQDAVAVVQEVAMLSDVHAAMYNRPSLVSPEHCYITRAGSVELPETTETESPEAVPELLRAMLAGRDAPEALEDLAFGMATRDMSGALAEFPVGNRRAVIAKLAARALGAVSGPSTAAFTSPERPASPAPPTAPVPPPLAAEAGAWPQPASAGTPVPAAAERPPSMAPPSHAHEAVALARETFRPVLVQPARPPHAAEPAPAAGAVQQRPPFVATPPFTTEPSSLARPDTTPSATERELERIRKRTAARERAARRWRERFGALVTWRPSFPDPRVLGSTAIVVAAILSVVWRSNVARPGTPPSVAIEVAPAATAPAAPPAAPAVSPTGGGSSTPPKAPPGPSAPASATAASAAALAAAPALAVAPVVPPAASPRRNAATPGGDASSEAPPRIALPSASRPPALDPAAPPAATTPSGATPTAPANPDATSRPAGGPAFDRASGAVVPAEPRTAPVNVAPDADAPAGALYTSGDEGVLPPVIRRQHLPSNLLEPMTEVPDDWPYLELLIDARGAVEQVRLHARQLLPGQTLYRHRMLLAAAKAWQFEPARRNGEAVRYLMRVPLEP